MAANKRKILEAARKYAQKGSKDRAIKEYEKLLAHDPKDAKLRLEIGDAYRRWGQVDEAVSAYTKVAEQYTKEGFDARAVAVYKQIQNLDSERYQTYAPLAELYQRMGLMSEAISALQTAADGYHKDGNKREALELLRKMASIDPTNTSSRIKVADLLKQEELHEEAIAEYEGASEELIRQGEQEAASGVYERILEIEPDRVATLAPLAQLLLKLGAADRAEPYAKRVETLEPGVPEHLELSAEVYGALSREEELVDTYRRLADLYIERGDEDRAREIRQRFVPPDAMAASTSGADVLDDATAFDPGPIAGDESEPELLTEELLEEELLEEELLEDEILGDSPPLLETDGGIFEEELTDVAPPAAEAEGVEVTQPLIPQQPVMPDPDTDPAQLLAEASVYLRYGKREQAIANLETVLASDADNRAAIEKLGEAHAEGGDPAQAVEQWLRAAELAKNEGDDEARSVLRDRIAALDEDAAAGIEIESGASDELELELDEPAGLSPEATVLKGFDEAPADELELDLAGDASDPGDLDDLGEIEIEIDESSFHDDEPSDDALSGELESDEPQSGEDEPAGRAPALDEVSLDTADFDSASASASMSAQINEDLEEAEFYTQQGLTEEAEAIYQRLQSIAPNHPLVQVRLGEIAAARGESPGGDSPGADTTATDEVDDATPASVAEGVDLEAWHADDDESLLPEGDEVVPEEEPEEDEAPLEIEPPVSDSLTDDGLGDSADLDLGLADDESPEDTGAEFESAPASIAEATAQCASLQASEEEPAGESFDLAAELNDAFDDDPSGRSGTWGDSAEDFAAVFSEFKKGVSETLSDGDHQTHYDLGIAYREMGLFADAMGEFESASGSDELRVECLHLMGLCALDQGEPARAVGYLDQAVEVPEISQEQGLAARFGLGRAYESLGDLVKAREAYIAVADVDPSFCEVSERLETLDEPEKPDDEASEFESFDDVMSEMDESDPDEDTLSGNDSPETEIVAEAEPESFEDFDDLMNDDESEVDPDPVVETPAAAEAVADEAGPDDETPEEPVTPVAEEPAAPPADDPPKPRRRKKKISFV